MNMFKKKKTGCIPPQYEVPPMPPIKPAKEKDVIDTNNLRVKTLETIRIETNKYNQIASIEFAELQGATKPTVSTNSSSVEFRSYIDGKMYDMKSVSFRDAFTPGTKLYLTGIFEDWISGELIYGEYDVLNYTFTRKEITI